MPNTFASVIDLPVSTESYLALSDFHVKKVIDVWNSSHDVFKYEQ